MKNCLIVDDVEVTRFISEQIVTALGLHPLVASNIEEAEKIFVSEKVDVTLLDWHLRKSSGLDLLAKIRAGNKRGMKVIMFSGVEGEEKRGEALHAGADAFLVKPTTKEKLEQCLKSIGIL